VATGGVATGGAESGGVGEVATGGVASGGAPTGGVATGGVATGGAPTGGVATGGVASGGAPTGGVATGGVATGGAPTGGVATGGVATGGTCVRCELRAALIHRYSFNGTSTSTVVTDSVGAAHGTVVNTTLSGAGTVVLAGGTSDQYVDLPNLLISGLTSATLEVWVNWAGASDGGSDCQRILDFGANSSGTEGSQGTSGTIFVMISPNCSNLRGSYRSSTTVDTYAEASSALATGVASHVALVLSASDQTLYLYLNGALQNQATGLSALSQLNDINNWLGRSQYQRDPELSGTIDEFRIYNVALSQVQIQASYAAGPDDPLTGQ
jgi:hypothetical protein